MKLRKALILTTCLIGMFDVSQTFARPSSSYSSRSSSSSMRSVSSGKSISMPSIKSSPSQTVMRANQKASAQAFDMFKSSERRESTKQYASGEAKQYAPTSPYTPSSNSSRTNYREEGSAQTADNSNRNRNRNDEPTVIHHNSGPSFGDMVTAGMLSNALTDHSRQDRNDYDDERRHEKNIPANNNSGLPQTGGGDNPFAPSADTPPPSNKIATPDTPTASEESPTLPHESAPAFSKPTKHLEAITTFLMFLLIIVLIGATIKIIYDKLIAPQIALRKDKRTQEIKSEIFGSKTNAQIIPQMPLLRIGSTLFLSTIETSNDPTTDESTQGLDFEPEATGKLSITAIGRLEGSNNKGWRLYVNEDMTDFVQINISGKKANEATFFSEIRKLTNSEEEWSAYMNDNDGMMGEQTIEHAGKTWTRAILPSEKSRIRPISERETIFTSQDGKEKKQISFESMLYTRETGFKNGFPQLEYMLLRACTEIEDGEKSMYLQIMGGVDLTPSSLNIN